jgi:hypothetical protein
MACMATGLGHTSVGRCLPPVLLGGCPTRPVRRDPVVSTLLEPTRLASARLTSGAGREWVDAWARSRAEREGRPPPASAGEKIIEIGGGKK